jgi:hypothetical protein
MLPRRKPEERHRAKHITIRIDAPSKVHPGHMYQVLISDGSRVIQRLIPATLDICLAVARERNRKAGFDIASIQYVGEQIDST